MKKLYCLICLLIIINNLTKACNPNFFYKNACAGDTVFFFGVQQYGAFTWDFGDTASGAANISHSMVNAYHIYSTPGIYYVTLTMQKANWWRTQTHELHIGTDCSEAGFVNNGCMSTSSYFFVNTSSGPFISSTWNFDDTASGANNSYVETYFNSLNNTGVIHSFSAPGTYNVSIITDYGTSTDTFVSGIVIDSFCYTNYFEILYDFNRLCINDTVDFHYGNYPFDSVFWDFGDPSSGVLNTSSVSGHHIYSSPGQYLIKLIWHFGIHVDTVYCTVFITDCNVWPGNANDDGIVDMDDFFAIGLDYHNSGPIRPLPSTNWTGQNSPSWSSFVSLQKPVNKKHSDCNGDGSIDSSDINVIKQNYGLIRPGYVHNEQLQPLAFKISDPILIVNTSTPPTAINVSVPIDITGVFLFNVYGISARIHYTNTSIVPGSVSISFANCWLGTPGIDLIGMYKDNFSQEYIDFGVVRTDNISRNGLGTIAYLNFTVNQSNPFILFNLDEIKRIVNGADGEQSEYYLPIYSYQTSLYATALSINEPGKDSEFLYPNPAGSILNVALKKSDLIISCDVFNALGRLEKISYSFNDNNLELATSSLSPGMYYLEITTEKERRVNRFIKQ
jgi:hypothetical protein